MGSKDIYYIFYDTVVSSVPCIVRYVTSRNEIKTDKVFQDISTMLFDGRKCSNGMIS